MTVRIHILYADKLKISLKFTEISKNHLKRSNLSMFKVSITDKHIFLQTYQNREKKATFASFLDMHIYK